MSQEDLFSLYFDYVGETESPTIYHRWTLLSVIGALLARKVYFPFGHGKIYPNQYMLLTGTPAARKGTAIKIGKNLLDSLDYAHITPNKAAKEAFWGWMAKKDIGDTDMDSLSSQEQLDHLFELEDPKNRITEAYVAHDEFLDFIGSGDKDFVTNLTNLWDNLPKYTNPKTRGPDVYIPNPTVSILSGITPSGIADSFGTLALGGGFFSRMLFIYAKPSGKRITFPSHPEPEIEQIILAKLSTIAMLEGELLLSPEVETIIDRIYKSTPKMPDPRFQYYMERRLTHLFKLIIILTASRLTTKTIPNDVILANTILYNAELSMPKALGEYGKARHANIANDILNALNNSNKPITLRELYKLVGRDLNKMQELLEILASLVEQDRVMKVSTGKGKPVAYIPNNVVNMEWDEDLINFNLLREEEHTR